MAQDIYSVVMVVTPEAACYSSYKEGEWEVGFSDEEAEATRLVEVYNQCRGEVMERLGLYYKVECVGEESTNRKTWYNPRRLGAATKR